LRDLHEQAAHLPPVVNHNSRNVKGDERRKSKDAASRARAREKMALQPPMGNADQSIMGARQRQIIRHLGGKGKGMHVELNCELFPSWLRLTSP